MFKWLKGHMPDITPAQIVAFFTFVVAQAVAWGWVDNDAGQKFLSTVGAAVPAVWMVVDSMIRGDRNKRMAAEAKADALMPPSPPTL